MSVKYRVKVWFSTDGYGRVNGKRGRLWTVHYAVVGPDGETYLYDNTGSSAWQEMLNVAVSEARTLRHLAIAGNAKIRPYRHGATPPLMGRDRVREMAS